MSLPAHFRTMASYNTLANRRLYEVCDRLTDAERKKRREAFFGSIHGTLNHLMAPIGYGWPASPVRTCPPPVLGLHRVIRPLGANGCVS